MLIVLLPEPIQKPPLAPWATSACALHGVSVLGSKNMSRQCIFCKSARTTTRHVCSTRILLCRTPCVVRAWPWFCTTSATTIGPRTRHCATFCTTQALCLLCGGPRRHGTVHEVVPGVTSRRLWTWGNAAAILRLRWDGGG